MLREAALPSAVAGKSLLTSAERQKFWGDGAALLDLY